MTTSDDLAASPSSAARTADDPVGASASESAVDAPWLTLTIGLIWFAAALATAVPLVGLGIAFHSDAASDPAWIQPSLILLASLPVAAALIFGLVLNVCLFAKEGWKNATSAALEQSVGGFFTAIGTLLSTAF